MHFKIQSYKNSEARKIEGLQSCLDNFEYPHQDYNDEGDQEVDETKRNFALDEGISPK
jgi:hypothetical protein